jgi:hypothetical protein
MRDHSKWFYLRITLLLVSVVAAPMFNRRMHDEFPLSKPPTIAFVLALVAFCAFAVMFVRTLQLLNPWFDTSWQIPSSEEPPFDISRPLASLDFGGQCLVVQGMAMAIYSAIHSFDYAWVLLVTAGLGALLGVRVVGEKPNNDVADSSL